MSWRPDPERGRGSGRTFFAGILLLLGACDGGASPAPWRGAILEVRAEPGAGLDLATLRWAPAEAARPLPGALPGRRLLLLLGTGPGRSLRLKARGGCSEQLALQNLRPGQLARVRLRGRFGANGFTRVLGLPARASAERQLRFLPACADAAREPLFVEALEHRGLAFRTMPAEHAVRFAMPRPPAPQSAFPPSDLQVIPLAPAQQVGRTFRLRAREGAAWVEQTLRVVALPRATGFPALALGQQVRIPAGPVHLVRAPSRGEGALFPGETPTFFPAVPGRWTLAYGPERGLDLSARRHDHTRLDCGRSECHPRASAAYARTPMAQIGRRGFEGELGPDFDPRCAIACHGTSEPGLPDGGAVLLAQELDFALPARGTKGTWASLPRDLRRVAGMGCTACHGPGSLPEHRSTWVILRAGVCATCHDAPPRYTKVAAWRRGRMSRADHRPETRAPACAPCHTTGGFLQALGHLARPVVPEGEDQPGPMGIACAACHTAHREDAGPHGLRVPPLPAQLKAPKDLPPESRVCLPCHVSTQARGASRLSHPGVAELVYGRESGSKGSAFPPSPHAAVPGGCLGCHRGHAFVVDRKICGDCHPDGPPEPSGAPARAFHGSPERDRDRDPDP